MMLLLAPLAGLCAAAAMVPPAEPITAQFKYKPAKRWTVVLPNETWTDVTNGIPISHENGSSFVAYKDGLKLALSVDTTGDGKPNKQVKGAKGYLVLRGKTRDGASLTYAARFKAKGKTYAFAASGYMTGVVAGETLRLIDQNNNGIYNEVGVDALIVGKGNAASYLSKVVHLKGELHQLSVSADGGQIEATPFTGETGTMDLRSGFDSKGKLVSAVVSSANGDYSFNLAKVKSLRVPIADYRISGGYVTKAGESVRVKTGKMRPVSVTLGKHVKVQWGGPVIGEFNFSKAGNVVKIEPTALKFFGAAGEEYVDFLPQGSSPKFFVYDETTERLIKTGRFGGC